MDERSLKEYELLVRAGTGIECSIGYSKIEKGQLAISASDISCAACLHALQEQFRSDSDNEKSFICAESHFVAWQKLLDAQEMSIGLVFSRVDTEIPPQTQISLMDWMALIKPRIEAELASEHELDSMALELVDRYDELNLVFTQDQSDLINVPLDEAITKSLHDCAQNLNLSAIALNLQQKHLICVQSRHPDNNTQTEMLYQLMPAVTEKLQLHTHSRVDNEGYESAALTGEVCKMIAVPIVDSSGEFEGSLIGLREVRQVDFTNSDRKLMDVIGRQLLSLLNQNYDSLTGSLNRSGFERRLSQALQAESASEAAHGQ